MEKDKNLNDVFKTSKPIIGMIHLFGDTDEEILEIAKREIDILVSNGMNAVLVENYACRKNEMVAAVLEYLATNRPNITYGVNMLGNYELAFKMADKYNAKFIQVDSVAGHLPMLYDLPFHNAINKLREKSNALLLGGVRFKYQPVLSSRSIEEDLKVGMRRCDAIVVTGKGTGLPTELDKIKYFRNIINDFPLIVGAGLTLDNCIEQLSIADGGIVGSYLKEGHVDSGYVSPTYTKEFADKVKILRK